MQGAGDKWRAGDETKHVSRIVAAEKLTLDATRQLIRETKEAGEAISALPQAGDSAPGLLPVSKFAFAKGVVESAGPLLCPLHTGYAEKSFHAQMATYDISPPPSKADEQGYFLSLPRDDALAQLHRKVQHLEALANKLDMKAATPPVVQSPGHALHLLMSGAAERGLSTDFGAAVAAAAAPSAAPPPSGTLFDTLRPPKRAQQGRPRAAVSKAPPPQPKRATAPSPAATWDDAALQARMDELEAAEAAAGYDEVWGVAVPPVLAGGRAPTVAPLPGPLPAASAATGTTRTNVDGTVDISEFEPPAAPAAAEVDLAPPKPTAKPVAGIAIPVVERGPVEGSPVAPSAAPRKKGRSLFSQRLRR